MLSWQYETARLSKTDLDDAIKPYETSFHCIGGAPLKRIAAARHGAQLLTVPGNEKRASIMADEAVKLLSLVCSHYLKYEDQQHAIPQVVSLTADACSLCLRREKGLNRDLENLGYDYKLSGSAERQPESWNRTYKMSTDCLDKRSISSSAHSRGLKKTLY